MCNCCEQMLWCLGAMAGIHYGWDSYMFSEPVNRCLKTIQKLVNRDLLYIVSKQLKGVTVGSFRSITERDNRSVNRFAIVINILIINRTVIG